MLSIFYAQNKVVKYRWRRAMSERRDSSRPLYAISVAAELSDVPVPTLRLFEAHGLVRPTRTPGGTRRYSEADVRAVKEVDELVQAGIPLAAIATILALTASIDQLRTRNTELQAANAGLRRAKRDQDSDLTQE